MDRFDALSPLDFRYQDDALTPYLSENGFVSYKCMVELALVKALQRRGLCEQDAVRAVTEACARITTAEVYEEEGRIKHDLRALVNCIRAKVPEHVRPYVHMSATSYDIVDTANAARFRDVTLNVLVPALKKLEGALIEIALREAETVQVGRTHGQHAVPITFGFAIAGTVDRLGGSILKLVALAEELPGKFSGAVGAYNASSLFLADPEVFEAEILAEMKLKPARHSTQIAQPEAMMRLLSETVIAAGVMADLADDMRHLQRTEIGEVGEEFGADQVGSSTMPQKRNPITFENAKSLWKILVGRMMTIYLDQLSEHQRDLTNSASTRTNGEVIAYAYTIAKRLERTMGKLTVDTTGLERNVRMQMGLVSAEPLYITLAAMGHPDAHECVRALTLKAQREGRGLADVVGVDEELRPYIERMTPQQFLALVDPPSYTGAAARRAREVAEHWKATFNL